MPPKKGMPVGDAKRGAEVFKSRAAQCHTAEKGGANRVGPNLYGIVGREAGTVDGYSYTQANSQSGVTWHEQELYDYLENPRKYLPGTKMAFAGLKKPQDRADIIAYMKTLAD
eukprot:TRINITY_DN33036_c0_g1_i1.p1 TRINITY_DN33036_c0_g1~~TRINITY_DN33036_c0_g1_i1.p1  ORF type:complete len:113 (+),score=21.60 TRINITY_DN33036_c0_g1_i1:39-377(+)